VEVEHYFEREVILGLDLVEVCVSVDSVIQKSEMSWQRVHFVEEMTRSVPKIHHLKYSLWCSYWYCCSSQPSGTPI
jgi:hypothetical protein